MTIFIIPDSQSCSNEFSYIAIMLLILAVFSLFNSVCTSCILTQATVLAPCRPQLGRQSVLQRVCRAQSQLTLA